MFRGVSLLIAVILVGAFARAGEAQINRLPDLLKRGGVKRPASLGGAPTAAKCKAVVDWMLILEREMAPMNLQTTVSDRIFPRAMNLFRDEHFRPMYGKPISETDSEEMLDFDRNVLRACGQQLNGDALAAFRRLNTIVGRPFRVRGGQFGLPEVVAGVAERESLAASMRADRAALQQIPATQEGFDELERQAARANTEFQKLWPREQQAFSDAVTAKQHEAARGVLEAANTRAAEHVAKGMDGARAIIASRTVHQRYLQVLDAEARAGFERRFEEQIAAALKSGVGSEKTRLAAMPAGLDGALAIVAWREALESELGDIQAPAEQAAPTGQARAAQPKSRALGTERRARQVPAELAALMTESLTLQQKRLAEGAGEFKQVVAQHPTQVRKGKNAAELMRALFADRSSRELPEFGEYQAVLAAHVDRQAKAAAVAATAAAEAAAAAVEAAKGPGERCDDAAAHPEDAATTGRGVEDGAVATALAVKHCAAAVAQSPGAGRYHFQLGRAHWSAKRYEPAIQAFLKAEELDYAPAYYYLGQAFERGLIAGEKPDPAAARDLYMIAAAEGFNPAIRAFGGDAPPTTVEDFAAFEHARFVELIYTNGFAKLEADRRFAFMVYLRGIENFLAQSPNEYEPTCSGMMEREVAEALDTAADRTAVPSSSSANPLQRLLDQASAMDYAERLKQNGTDDMYALAADYGGCKGPVVRRFYGNLKQYLLSGANPGRQ